MRFQHVVCATCLVARSDVQMNQHPLIHFGHKPLRESRPESFSGRAGTGEPLRFNNRTFETIMDAMSTSRASM